MALAQHAAPLYAYGTAAAAAGPQLGSEPGTARPHRRGRLAGVQSCVCGMAGRLSIPSSGTMPTATGSRRCGMIRHIAGAYATTMHGAVCRKGCTEDCSCSWQAAMATSALLVHACMQPAHYDSCRDCPSAAARGGCSAASPHACTRRLHTQAGHLATWRIHKPQAQAHGPTLLLARPAVRAGLCLPSCQAAIPGPAALC